MLKSSPEQIRRNNDYMPPLDLWTESQEKVAHREIDEAVKLLTEADLRLHTVLGDNSQVRTIKIINAGFLCGDVGKALAEYEGAQ